MNFMPRKDIFYIIRDLSLFSDSSLNQIALDTQIEKEKYKRLDAE